MEKILATDLDGTLFYPRRKIRLIARPNIEVLRRHIERGGKVVIVSGRNVPFAQKVMEKVGYPLDVVCCNSAIVQAGGRILRAKGLSKDIGYFIYENAIKQFGARSVAAMSKDESLVIYYHEINFIKRIGYSIVYKYQGVYGERYVNGLTPLLEEIEKGEVYKMMIYFGLGKKGNRRAHQAKAFLEEQGVAVECFIDGGFMEVTPEGCTKDEGLRLIAEYYQLDKKDLFVVGDSWNDVPMFDRFPNSFCMAHAHKDVKKRAAHVIRRFRDIENYLD